MKPHQVPASCWLLQHEALCWLRASVKLPLMTGYMLKLSWDVSAGVHVLNINSGEVPH